MTWISASSRTHDRHVPCILRCGRNDRGESDPLNSRIPKFRTYVCRPRSWRMTSGCCFASCSFSTSISGFTILGLRHSKFRWSMFFNLLPSSSPQHLRRIEVGIRYTLGTEPTLPLIRCVLPPTPEVFPNFTQVSVTSVGPKDGKTSSSILRIPAYGGMLVPKSAFNLDRAGIPIPAAVLSHI